MERLKIIMCIISLLGSSTGQNGYVYPRPENQLTSGLSTSPPSLSTPSGFKPGSSTSTIGSKPSRPNYNQQPSGPDRPDYTQPSSGQSRPSFNHQLTRPPRPGYNQQPPGSSRPDYFQQPSEPSQGGYPSSVSGQNGYKGPQEGTTHRFPDQQDTVSNQNGYPSGRPSGPAFPTPPIQQGPSETPQKPSTSYPGQTGPSATYPDQIGPSETYPGQNHPQEYSNQNGLSPSSYPNQENPPLPSSTFSGQVAGSQKPSGQISPQRPSSSFPGNQGLSASHSGVRPQGPSQTYFEVSGPQEPSSSFPGQPGFEGTTTKFPSQQTRPPSYQGQSGLPSQSQNIASQSPPSQTEIQRPSAFTSDQSGGQIPGIFTTGFSNGQAPSISSAGQLETSVGQSPTFNSNEAPFGRPETSDGGSHEGGDYSAIPGEPGIDYPIFSVIPETSFRCDQQQFPGYYADIETQCQVFHICANNKTYDFLCPNGTVFHQEYFVCVWWNQFDCNTALSLYGLNENLYDYTKIGSPGTSFTVPAPNLQYQGPSTGISGFGTEGPPATFTPGVQGPSGTFGTGPQGPLGTFGFTAGPQTHFGGGPGSQGPSSTFGEPQRPSGFERPQGPSSTSFGTTSPQGPTENFRPQRPSTSLASVPGSQDLPPSNYPSAQRPQGLENQYTGQSSQPGQPEDSDSYPGQPPSTNIPSSYPEAPFPQGPSAYPGSPGSQSFIPTSPGTQRPATPSYSGTDTGYPTSSGSEGPSFQYPTVNDQQRPDQSSSRPGVNIQADTPQGGPETKPSREYLPVYKR